MYKYQAQIIYAPDLIFFVLNAFCICSTFAYRTFLTLAFIFFFPWQHPHRSPLQYLGTHANHLLVVPIHSAKYRQMAAHPALVWQDMWVHHQAVVLNVLSIVNVQVILPASTKSVKILVRDLVEPVQNVMLWCTFLIVSVHQASQETHSHYALLLNVSLILTCNNIWALV